MKKNENVVLSKIDENVYKLDMIPITSVFFVRYGEDCYLIDTGQSEEDVRNHILPAISQLQIRLSKIKGIFITHNHWDHIDGIPELLRACPRAKVYLACPETNPYYDAARFVKVSDNEWIDGFMRVVAVPGHADDCVAFLDTRTNTLFSGDAIQLYGVSNCGMLLYGTIEQYIESMEKLQNLEIDNIMASHPYVPCGAFAYGIEKTRKHIETSLSCIYDLITFVEKEMKEGNHNVERIKRKYIESRKKSYADFPTDGFEQAIQSVLSRNDEYYKKRGQKRC